MAAQKKKTFSDCNPALAFISPQPQKNTEGTPNTAPAQNTEPTPSTPVYTREKKTRRLNLSLQPSTMEAITKIAFMKRISANDLINRVLKQYVKDNPDLLAQYDAIFPKED